MSSYLLNINLGSSCCVPGSILDFGKLGLANYEDCLSTAATAAVGKVAYETTVMTGTQ